MVRRASGKPIYVSRSDPDKKSHNVNSRMSVYDANCTSPQPNNPSAMCVHPLRVHVPK